MRNDLKRRYHLVDENTLSFAWITDFPLFEKDEKTGKLDFAHNPFSSINATIEDLRMMNPLDIYSFQYDLTLNGYEILSGSIRNHNLELLIEAFRMVGRSEEEVKTKFGGMYEAFQYGVPPHGGFAFGIDRFMMILLNEENIRDMYAFPKSGKAQDMMMNAPSDVDEESLRELHIKLLENTESEPLGNRELNATIKSTYGTLAEKILQHTPVKTSQEASKVRNTEISEQAKALLYIGSTGEIIMCVVQADKNLDETKLAQLRPEQNWSLAPASILKQFHLVQ